MTYRLLLATTDAGLAADTAALVEESDQLTLVGAVTTAASVVDRLATADVDVVLLHEDLGPLSVIDHARELASRFPDVGVVLIVREGQRDLLRAALQCGVRGVLNLPLSLEELQAAAGAAADWSRSIRDRFANDAVEAGEGGSGVTIAVAGAKGGVGTTTLAVHLALAAARASADRSVCLVDLDLQSGDVPCLLDVSHQRGIVDLVEVADDVTPRSLEQSLYVHSSGLRVLLGPDEGERSEEVDASAARGILAGIGRRFDVVIVDAGAVVTEAGAMAVELADQVLLVATPDVPALRAANRLLALWERLHARKPEDVIVLMNRVSKSTEVQPDLARRVVTAPLARTSVPAGFKELESATNTGDPARLENGPVGKAVDALACEVGIGTPPSGRRSRRGEAGQVAVESLGVITLILVVAVVLWQMVLTGYTFALAGHAAREGARQLAVGASPAVVEAAVRADLPSAWRSGVRVRRGTERVEVSVEVPAVMPGRGSGLRLSASTATVRER